jgi:phenylacetate-CoA ligase
MQKIDTDHLNKEEINTFQVEELKFLLQYLNEHSTFYKNQFKSLGIDISTIKSLEDLKKFPFTNKEDLANNNEQFLCVPKNKVADYVTTSGTIGDPVTFYLTHKDIDRLGYNESKSLECAGGSAEDVFQLMTTIDKRFMAGLAYLNGVLKLKAGIIRVGPGSPHLQWDSILRFKPTFLIAIPSFIPKLIEYAIKNNIDYRNTSVQSIVCIGEPIRDKNLGLSELGKRIKSQWDVNLFSTYASTEMGAAFTECEHSAGGHLRPELLILEVVDEEGNAVKNETQGEVVVTTLGVEGMPLLRYKTGDICKVYFEKCKCGRSSTRLGPVLGRKKQMLKYKGTTVFPPAIFDILDMVPEVDLYQLEIAFDEYFNDDIKIILSKEIFGKEFEKDLISLFRSRLRVVPKLEFIETELLKKRIFNPEKRKPTKILDLRK